MNRTTAPARTKQRPGLASLGPVYPDDKLSAVIGGHPVSRIEMVKRIWDYIVKHGLQDGQNRMIIHADDKLRAVFDGRARVTMFEMTKLVSGHLLERQ